MTLKKPICFSYREYVELLEAYKALLDDNQKLQSDNRELRDKLTNMEIKVRILEEDRPRVAYKCDGRACKDDLCRDRRRRDGRKESGDGIKWLTIILL